MHTRFCIAFLIFVSGLAGCGGPISSTRLATTTNIHVESLPSDADVFNVDEHGKVDKHLGKTPLTIPVSTVSPRDSSGDCNGKFSAWSPAGYWSRIGRDTTNSYRVSLYVTKEGYYDSYVSSTLEYQCDAEQPEDRHMKVILDAVRQDDEPVQVQNP